MVPASVVSMYAELHMHTNYSFQEGASSIDEMLERAAELGYTALAITDHDNLCGAVSFADACHAAGIQPITGCEVTLSSGANPPWRTRGPRPGPEIEGRYHLTLLAETRKGYGNLCWLISQAYRDDRLTPALQPGLLEGHTEGLIALSGCRGGLVSSLVDAHRFEEARAAAQRYAELFGPGNFFLELQQHLVLGDTQRNRSLVRLANDLGISVVATGNVHYHIRERHRLQDCLVAIKNNLSLKDSHRQRRANSEFFLKPPATMAALFAWCPEAIRQTTVIAERCKAFDLKQDLGYQFPGYDDLPSGHTPQSYLEQLCYDAARLRYGDITPQIKERLVTEFALIKKHNLAGFFLIYRDIIGLAQEVAVELGMANPEVPTNISPPGRGRGSSVSMLVGYLFGISHIDPVQFNLSLHRFLPDGEMASVPDIDLDFPRNIRERLIIRVHEKYGWERAALTGMITTYRVHGCVRDLGKALDLPPDEVAKLAKRIEERDGLSIHDEMVTLQDFQQKVGEPLWKEFLQLASELDGFPRQLAQHPGGMVIGSSPLTDIVPIQPSAMNGRYVMQWDKDAIETARFVKIDFLALGALSQLQRVISAIKERHDKIVDVSRIDFDDQLVYKMLHKADTIGIFQVESAAQQQTITRLKPDNLVKMAHEVAAVRPGVGANDGVRQYILRELGLAEDVYDHPLMEPALGHTHGVILFQDQVNQVAHDVGGLTYTEADHLRRAMSKRHNEKNIQTWRERFVSGAMQKGVDEETALKVFGRFNGHYMFPEAHAFAFGVTAYQLAWLKYYYPLEFYLGLFNEQPMGFYTPETLKQDAKQHGVDVLNPDVNRSLALCTHEGNAIRLGLLYVFSLGEASAKSIVVAKKQEPFASLADFVARSGLNQGQIKDLIDAGAMDSLNADRRLAAWETGLRYQPLHKQLPLQMPVGPYMAPLPKAGAFEEMVREYRTMGMHPSSHVMAYIRESLGEEVLPSTEVQRRTDGEKVKVAGLVIRRQRPLAKAVFVTLEDEFGHIPMVVWPKAYAKLREKLKAPFLIATGTVSRRDDTFNIVVTDVEPRYVIPDPPESRNFR